ncbi:MAG TPA: TetR/AcrR family transcriptional regulator [Pseudonocardiaceae bacterium]|nr:TetR/AcrR family transcriptional regulator [Pseudonocardiaceae bacterium]
MADDPNTRERILRTASGLFQRQGYHATGLNQVLAEGKAPKGSLYFHFPRGKEQLAAEAVATGGRTIADDLRGTPPGTRPLASLVSFVERLGAELAATGFRAGSPIATVALDVASDSEPIRVACVGAYRSWSDALTARFAEWGVPAERRQTLATVVIAAVEGALLLARVRQDLTPLHEVAERLGDLVAGESRPVTGP